jgi:hypothetical protein
MSDTKTNTPNEQSSAAINFATRAAGILGLAKILVLLAPIPFASILYCPADKVCFFFGDTVATLSGLNPLGIGINPPPGGGLVGIVGIGPFIALLTGLGAVAIMIAINFHKPLGVIRQTAVRMRRISIVSLGGLLLSACPIAGLLFIPGSLLLGFWIIVAIDVVCIVLLSQALAINKLPDDGREVVGREHEHPLAPQMQNRAIDQATVDRLTADLRSNDAARRIAAAEEIAERKLFQADLVNVLRGIARADHFMVREAAEQALRAASAGPDQGHPVDD